MRRVLLLLLVAGCSLGDAGAPSAGPPEAPFVGYLPQRVRRLGAREVTQAILDATTIAVPEGRVAALVTRRKYDNGDPDAWVTTEVLAAVEDLAWFVADEVVRMRPARVFGSCDSAEACKAHVLGVVLPRILRRGLSGTEEAAYASLWSATANRDADDGVRVVIATALQSPAFLYRNEVGQPRAADAKSSELDPHEIAAELSFLVTGSAPDDELLEVARDSRLLDAGERVSQMSRLLRTPAAAAYQRHFLELYLATVEVKELRKSPKVFPDFRQGEALGLDLRAMLDEVVREGGSTEQLLSQPHTIGEPLLASHAGGPPIRGVLMHPAFLAMHGGFAHSNPVGRGLFVLTNLLCAPPQPPPQGIPRVPKDESPATTTRQKFAEHSSGSCQGCHRAIDGIGFGFEQFDGAGRFRETENGVTVDSSGLLPVDDDEVPYNGVAALSARLARSPQVADCFARHVVRFALGGGERVEDVRLYDALAQGTAPDTTFEARLRRIVASPTFVRRRTP